MTGLASAGAPWPAAVAVSGGGDSLALMVLLAEWAKAHAKLLPVVLTVDHGLRAGSARDAKAVLAAAKAEGLQAHALKWTGPKPRSDIEAAARAARYRLMGAWCHRHQVPALYLAHTREDQAETFLLRLARGTGLDGLTAMQPVAPFPLPGFADLKLARPLLGMGRADLRDFLKARDLAWSEDPMNDDPRFARVRLRALWPALEAEGLTPARIADAAAHLARARTALEAAVSEVLASHARFDKARVTLDAGVFSNTTEEVGLRVLAAVLCRVSGAAYRPRFDRLKRIYAAILGGKLGNGRTLHGCRIAPAPKRHAHFGAATLMIVRETGRGAGSTPARV